MNQKLLKRLRKVFYNHGLINRLPPCYYQIHLWSPQSFGKTHPREMKILQLGVKKGLVRREKLPEMHWGKLERRYTLIPEEIRRRLEGQNV